MAAAGTAAKHDYPTATLAAEGRLRTVESGRPVIEAGAPPCWARLSIDRTMAAAAKLFKLMINWC